MTDPPWGCHALARGVSAVGFSHGAPLTGAAVDAYESFLSRAAADL
ncbi:hypothetical protein Misp01_65130 [Microtetraspora sp. NBRC 13810]|nr:hypothetical protein [Microtetraspora sp. NBRC 13810]GLW11385.1 hypothetical protein Misp01_65130 [Microtetraspora sp. NBRC 13810]